jgi:hypothetical protein
MTSNLKLLLRLYRPLSYLFSLSLLIGLIFSAYEFFVKQANYELDSLFVNIGITYYLISIIFFIKKTKPFYNSNQADSLNGNSTTYRFKFDVIISITILFLGFVLAIIPPAFLFINPPNSSETLRVVVVLLLAIYGILKIIYSFRILNIILSRNANKT